MPATDPTPAARRPPDHPVAAPALPFWIVVGVRSRFWLKAVGTSTFMALFFVGYFHVLRNPASAVTAMPLTGIDHWIGFTPWALWPYVSLWLYVALPPALLSTTRELLRYTRWIGALCAAGLACFMWWPTAVPQLVTGVEHAGFHLLRGVDAAGNACPSLHVATASFSAWWLDHLLRVTAAPRRLRLLNLGWFALIVWSTLATKQHVWWDVVAGLALALLFAPASLPRRSGGRGDAAIMARRG
jgi:PAP2 superfamily